MDGQRFTRAQQTGEQSWVINLRIINIRDLLRRALYLPWRAVYLPCRVAYLQHGDCRIDASGQEETWCFCGQVEFGKMILCDNAKCHIKWFHYSCINVKVAPKGKWYCPKCQKLPKFEPKKGKKPLK
uniref:PHD-type domain-containing protein n=1 Tax=Gadus morhua TaxID=8049 RepID=A0A8C5ATN8_GADMO